jgi:hypothetical protein
MKFNLKAQVSRSEARSIRRALEQLAAKGSVRKADEVFVASGDNTAERFFDYPWPSKSRYSFNLFGNPICGRLDTNSLRNVRKSPVLRKIPQGRSFPALHNVSSSFPIALWLLIGAAV